MPEEQACLFHRYVVQLLFLSTRVRRDTKTAVAFLTTRVKSPDKDDWGKLGRVMRYLTGCSDLPLVGMDPKSLEVPRGSHAMSVGAAG